MNKRDILARIVATAVVGGLAYLIVLGITYFVSFLETLSIEYFIR